MLDILNQMTPPLIFIIVNIYYSIIIMTNYLDFTLNIYISML